MFLDPHLYNTTFDYTFNEITKNTKVSAFLKI